MIKIASWVKLCGVYRVWHAFVQWEPVNFGNGSLFLTFYTNWDSVHFTFLISTSLIIVNAFRIRSLFMVYLLLDFAFEQSHEKRYCTNRFDVWSCRWLQWQFFCSRVETFNILSKIWRCFIFKSKWHRIYTGFRSKSSSKRQNKYIFSNFITKIIYKPLARAPKTEITRLLRFGG